MAIIETKINGVKEIKLNENENYVWVREKIDDKGANYYVTESGDHPCTSCLRNAETWALGPRPRGKLKLVKITYEIVDEIVDEITGEVIKDSDNTLMQKGVMDGSPSFYRIGDRICNNVR